MGNKNNYNEDMIERYIYQVKKHLSSPTEDIEQEIRSMIYEMLEARTKDAAPTKEDMDTVLTELGNPSVLAENYRGKARYLIGPGIYPTYLMILKIVLPTILLAMTIVTILELLTGEKQVWYDYIVHWFSNMWGALLGAFAWVTCIFAIFEARGIDTKDLSSPWAVSSLPPVPKDETAIPISESILGIIFHTFLVIVFVSAPQLIGAFFYHEGMTAVPLFDLEVLADLLPLFLIAIGLGLLRNVFGLIERRYSIRYAVFSVISSFSELILSLIIFTGFPIWNQEFPDHFNNSVVNRIWDSVTENFTIFLVLVYLLDAGTILYKTFKNKLR